MYRKGTQNQNADALSRLDTKELESRPTATTILQPSPFLAQLREAQMKDEHMQQLHSSLATSQTTLKGRHWQRYPLQRHRQIFHQLLLVNNIVYRKYSPGPTSDTVTVPVIPKALRQQILQQNHDLPSSGHLGADKTLGRLQNEAY